MQLQNRNVVPKGILNDGEHRQTSSVLMGLKYHGLV